MPKIRFVVLGDTHFCTEEIRGVSNERYPLADIPDHVRYSQMIDTVLKLMFRDIKALNPDIVLSTGDFVEGGMDSDEIHTYQEMEQGWQMLKELGCPVMIAKGTHEGHGKQTGAKAYQDIVLPGMSKMLKQTIENTYFSYEQESNLFIILDYLSYKTGEAQDLWLEETLQEKSDKAEHIYIFAHPPLYNWGRHFFTEPEFRKRLTALCGKYPVDVYFCGHTHNQAISFHQTNSDKLGYLQVMGSSVGYPDMDIFALTEFHSPAEFSANDHYLSGIFEDSAPGFYLIDADKDKMNIKWHSILNCTAEFASDERRKKPSPLQLPTYRASEKHLQNSDFDQIKSASLYIFGYYGDGNSTELKFNGISLGPLPCNVSYAARRYLALDIKALLSIQRENHVELNLSENDEFVIGSLSLELRLYDNRIIHSTVCPDIVTCGNRWREFNWMSNKITEVECGKSFSLTLSL